MPRHILDPDIYCASVFTIPLSDLHARGITVLLMDLDNTLLPRDREELPADVVDWVRGLPDAGLRACLVSNNWHERAFCMAERLGLPVVAKALKPLPFAFTRALRILSAPKSAAAVVGDQLFTDVLGGRMLGLTTVLVQPQSSHDLPHTLVLRHIEARLLAGREPLP